MLGTYAVFENFENFGILEILEILESFENSFSQGSQSDPDERSAYLCNSSTVQRRSESGAIIMMLVLHSESKQSMYTKAPLRQVVMR